MKPHIFFIILTALCVCSCEKKSTNEDGWPPYGISYSPLVAFIDQDGNDLSSKVRLEEKDGSPNADKSYSLMNEGYALRCYVDGQEFRNGDVSETLMGPAPVKIAISGYKPEGSRYVFFRLDFFQYWMPLDEYVKGDIHKFEYRFTLPSILGAGENVLTIESVPQEFHYGKVKTARFNDQELPECDGRDYGFSASNGEHYFVITL